MNCFREIAENLLADHERLPPSKKSKSKSGKHNTTRGKRPNLKPPRRHATHFYDPETGEIVESSSDEQGLSELNRKRADTLTRIEGAEAALAKERKRVEQLETRERDAQAREQRQRAQRDEEGNMSPRDRNRCAFERAVAKVERRALEEIEELERRFAHSDKIFEIKLAQQKAQTQD